MARVLVDTWYAAHGHQISAEALRKRREEWGYAESEQGWRRSIREAQGSSDLILVAVEGAGIVGVAASELTEPGCAEVGALYVDVAHQGSGIGRRLLEAITDHYRALGVSTLHIAVLAANREARGFYERLGGRLSETRDHDDGPEVVYRWDLAPHEDC